MILSLPSPQCFSFVPYCRSFLHQSLFKESLDVAMHLTQLFTAALLAAGASTVEAGPLLKAAAERPLNLANVTLEQLSQNALTVAKATIPSNSTCTPDKLTVRRSW